MGVAEVSLENSLYDGDLIVVFRYGKGYYIEEKRGLIMLFWR